MTTQAPLLSYALTGVVYDDQGNCYCVGESTSKAATMQKDIAHYANAANFAAWDLVASVTNLNTNEIKRENIKKALTR